MENHTKNKIFRILLALSIIFIIGLVAWTVSIQKESQESIDTTKNQSSTISESKAQLRVEGLSESPQSFEFDIKEGDTAFDLLKETGLDVDYTEYDFGIFINAIEGIENDEEKSMNWMYYVNGKKAEIGAREYIVKSDDNIEWKYEKISW